mgnify:CR=1 FL=1
MNTQQFKDLKAELESLQAENFTTAQAIAQMWGGDGQSFQHENTQICIVEFCRFLSTYYYVRPYWQEHSVDWNIQEIFVIKDNSFLRLEKFWDMDIECPAGQVIIDGQIYK